MITDATLERRPVIPAISADAMILCATMAKLAPGETASYEALSAAIGRDVRGRALGVLRTAMTRVMRDHGVVVECVRNVGYRRVDGLELVHAQRAGIDRIRGEARRRAEKLRHVDYAKLENGERVGVMGLASMYGAFAHMATAKSVAKIESAIDKAKAAELPIGKTLALFQE